MPGIVKRFKNFFTKSKQNVFQVLDLPVLNSQSQRGLNGAIALLFKKTKDNSGTQNDFQNLFFCSDEAQATDATEKKFQSLPEYEDKFVGKQTMGIILRNINLHIKKNYDFVNQITNFNAIGAKNIEIKLHKVTNGNITYYGFIVLDKGEKRYWVVQITENSTVATTVNREINNVKMFSCTSVLKSPVVQQPGAPPANTVANPGAAPAITVVQPSPQGNGGVSPLVHAGGSNPGATPANTVVQPSPQGNGGVSPLVHAGGSNPNAPPATLGKVIADYAIEVFLTPQFLEKTVPKMSAQLINEQTDAIHRYKWDIASIKDYAHDKTKQTFRSPVLQSTLVTYIRFLYHKTEEKDKNSQELYSRFIMLMCGVSLQDKVVLDCRTRKFTNWTVVHGFESTFAIFRDEYVHPDNAAAYTIVYAGRQVPVNGLLEWKQVA
jgi:hypothetical protein